MKAIIYLANDNNGFAKFAFIEELLFNQVLLKLSNRLWSKRYFTRFFAKSVNSRIKFENTYDLKSQKSFKKSSMIASALEALRLASAWSRMRTASSSWDIWCWFASDKSLT